MSKDLVIKALQRQPTQRTPWVPFVGVHGASLIGLDAATYLHSTEAIIKGLKEAKRRYQPDGLPLLFDLQLEAEALGCELKWASDLPPSVISHPLAEMPADLPAFDPSKGRIPLVAELTRTARQELGNDLALFGLITGPFTLAMHLLGNDIFLTMYEDEDYISRVVEFAGDVAITMSELYLDNGADVIAVVDPMTSQISSEHFEQFVSPVLNRVYDRIHELNSFGSLFVCGDATRNLEVMCQTHCDNFCIDENIPLEFARELAQKHKKSFGGNMKLTSVLLLGDENATRKHVLECLNAGETDGYILAPGCDLPYAVPPENLEVVCPILTDPYQRQVAEAATSEDKTDNFEDIELPEYKEAAEVLIDVITLDSGSCAPCQYMMNAVLKAVEQCNVPVSVAERKIKNREGLGFLTKLGVTNVPTICIDGETAFSSIIPDKTTLIEKIKRSAEKKFGMDLV